MCVDNEELHQFKAQLHILHPRLIPMFKLQFIIHQDEDHCGNNQVELDMTSAQDICFDGTNLPLSHCAEAFVNQMMSPRDGLRYLSSLKESQIITTWTHQQKQWLSLCVLWFQQNRSIILLKEEN